jgi:YVTN family beta-propeller protein
LSRTRYNTAVLSRRALLAAPLALAACRREEAGFPGYAFIANREGGAVAAVDLGIFQLARHIRLDGNPSQVLTAGKFAYALTPESGSIHRLDASKLTLDATLKVAPTLDTLRLAANARSIWAFARRALHRIDLESFRPAARIALPEPVLDADFSFESPVAAASHSNGTVTILDLAAARIARTLSLPSAGPLRFLKNGRWLLIGDPASRRLSIFETASGAEVVHLPLAVRPDRVCLSADWGQLFINGEGSDAIAVVYPYQSQVAATVLAGNAPHAMAVSASPALLFVANPSSGTVTVLDVTSQRVIAAVSVGRNPSHIIVTPDQQYALVLNRASGDLAVLRLQAIAQTSRRTKSAPLLMMIPVGSAPVSAAIAAV